MPYNRNITKNNTDPDGAVTDSGAIGLVGTGFASRYRLQPIAVILKVQWIGVRPLYSLLSHQQLTKPIISLSRQSRTACLNLKWI